MQRVPFRRTPAPLALQKKRFAHSPRFLKLQRPFGLEQKFFCSPGFAVGLKRAVICAPLKPDHAMNFRSLEKKEAGSSNDWKTGFRIQGFSI
jgi:hypothetical protein